MKFSPPIFFALCLAAVSGFGATIEVAGSIQRAHDLAKDGDVLIINGPAVFHEHVKITKQVELRGVNHPVIEGDATGTPLTIEGPGTEVRGLTVRNGGTDLGHPDAGIMIRAADVVVDGCRVEDGGFGIYLRSGGHSRIVNNTVSGNRRIPNAQRGNGIHLWNTKSNVIANNTVIGSRDGSSNTG